MPPTVSDANVSPYGLEKAGSYMACLPPCMNEVTDCWWKAASLVVEVFCLFFFDKRSCMVILYCHISSIVARYNSTIVIKH